MIYTRYHKKVIINYFLILFIFMSNSINQISPLNYDSSYSSFSDLLVTIGNNKQQQQVNNNKSNHNSGGKPSRISCEDLGRILGRKQLDLCYKHIDLLHLLLTQTLKKSIEECQKLFMHLKWNCSSIDGFLDRSSPLSRIKEASFVRALISAAAAHIVSEACASGRFSSCGCLDNVAVSSDPYRQHQQQNHRRRQMGMISNRKESFPTPNNESAPIVNEIALNQQQQQQQNSVLMIYNRSMNILSLDSGKPIRIMNKKSLDESHECNHNIAFGAAFTRTFLDMEDTKLLNKANKILNHNFMNPRSMIKNMKRSELSAAQERVDHMELAFLRWTNAAVNLHNNNLGLKVYQDSIKEKCVCHGISASCQFKTCWRQTGDFKIIAHKLREIYFSQSTRVYAENMGTFDNPDLFLAKRDKQQSITAPTMKVRSHDDQINIPSNLNTKFENQDHRHQSPPYTTSTNSISSSEDDPLRSFGHQSSRNVIERRRTLNTLDSDGDFHYLTGADNLNFHHHHIPSSSGDEENTIPSNIHHLEHHQDEDILRPSVYDLIYLSKSPDYCDSIDSINHSGTKGRSCLPEKYFTHTSTTTIHQTRRRISGSSAVSILNNHHTHELAGQEEDKLDDDEVKDKFRHHHQAMNSTSNNNRRLEQQQEATTNNILTTSNSLDISKMDLHNHGDWVSYGQLGKCEDLCCDRGYTSELRLHSVSCNCRFKFCCRVICDRCLKQTQHYRCL